jgi:hypothetical protein
MIQNLSVYIKTVNGFYLTAVNGGGVGPIAGQASVALYSNGTQAQALVRGPESFQLVPIAGGQYAIQTITGNYVTAVNGGGIGGPNDGSSPFHTDQVKPDGWELFILSQIPGFSGSATQPIVSIGMMTLSGWSFVGPFGFPFPTFTTNFITAQNGGNVNNPANGPIHTDATKIGQWETFTLINPATGGVVVFS